MRSAGAKTNDSCGIHIHINAQPHTAQSLRNIANIMTSKEEREGGGGSRCPKGRREMKYYIAYGSNMNIEQMAVRLAEYRDWWNERKIIYWDIWKNSDRLFFQENVKPRCGLTFASWLKEFQMKYNLKNVTPHGLRHSHITLLINNNIDVKTVSLRMGHAEVGTTLNIYTQYTKEADIKAANKINELLAFN